MREHRAWRVCVALDVYKYGLDAAMLFRARALTCAPPTSPPPRRLSFAVALC